MTTKSRTREPDVKVREPLARRLKLQNGVDVHHHRAHKYRRIADKRFSCRKIDAKFTRLKSRSESPHHSLKLVSDQKVNASNSLAEKSFEPHLKEDEMVNVSAAQDVSNGGTGSSDRLSLPAEKVAERGAAEEDCRIERACRKEDQQSGFVRYKKERDGTENYRYLGWSVLIKGPEHAEISKSDEDDMLRLSQPSASENPVLEAVTSQVDFVPPNGKKTRKSRVLKRPRLCKAKQSLSSNILEILHRTSHSPESLQSVERLTKDSELMRTGATSQALRNVDGREALSPELPKKVKSVQKWETTIAEGDAMKDRDTLSRDVRKNLLSFKTQKNSVITQHCVDAPGFKQRKDNEERYSGIKRDVQAATDPSDSQAFSTSHAIPKEREVLKTRCSIINVKDDTLKERLFQKFQEQQYTSARECNEWQGTRELNNLPKAKDNASVLSESTRTKENMTVIENSPRRRGKESKNRRNGGSVSNESPTQVLDLPTGEDGYSISEEAVDIGRLVRQQLLAGRSKSNEVETSEEPSSRVDSSNANECSRDARVEPKSKRDDSDDTRHQRIEGCSDKQTSNSPRRIPKRPRIVCGAEVEKETHRKSRHDKCNSVGGLAAGQTAINSRRRNYHENVGQAEAQDSCLKLSGLRQSPVMKATTCILGSRSRAPHEANNSAKEISSKGSYLHHSHSPRLEGGQNAQDSDLEEQNRESEPWSKKLEHRSLQDEELGVPGSIPSDLSEKNRLRMHQRKQSEVQEAMWQTGQSGSPCEQMENQKQKKNRKGYVTPSSVTQVTQECRSVTTKSAATRVPSDVLEKVLEQPTITESGDEGGVNFFEAKEMSSQANVLIDDAERIESTSMRERKSTQSGTSHLHPQKQFDSEPALNESAPRVRTSRRSAREKQSLNPMGKVDSGYETVAKASIEQILDDLVDQKSLEEQSKLLIRRSKRSRRSRIDGARRDRSIKALDELSDNEDSKDEAWATAASSSIQQRSKTKQVPKAQSHKTHPMKTRGKGTTSCRAPLEPHTIIDLTDVGNGDDENAVTDPRGTKDDDDIAESLKELQRLSLQDKTKRVSERPSCKYLAPLNDDESKLATDLTTRTKRDTKIVAIGEAGITLRGESFKRLRGARWLDDEVLNAYVSLINSRNDAVFGEMDEGHRIGIPRTYVFNTYFFTRLCSGSSGFDYPGVKGWTKRAKVDILKRDIILVPINLGNHHWVLSGVDMEHKEVMYLDSMHGPDIVNAVSKLKRWVFEELSHKHGEDIAAQLDPNSWKTVTHSYRIRRVGVLPEKLEPRDATAGRIAKVPKQTDGGSCGVFTAKIADCMSLGIKVYFKQKDIHLIRRRMALDLFNGYIPL